MMNQARILNEMTLNYERLKDTEGGIPPFQGKRSMACPYWGPCFKRSSEAIASCWSQAIGGLIW